MLIERWFLDELAAGRADLAFRRWPRARVKVGTRLRTAVGVVEVVSVDVVPMAGISQREARRAGYESAKQLRGELRARKGRAHRIRLRPAGPDPRQALARRSRLSEDEVAEIRVRLERMDSRSRSGAWTLRTLELIQANPGTRAGDLVPRTGMELRAFKANVRKLKGLGLTESLDVGYRLSRRGEAVLARFISGRRMLFRIRSRTG